MICFVVQSDAWFTHLTMALYFAGLIIISISALPGSSVCITYFSISRNSGSFYQGVRVKGCSACCLIRKGKIRQKTLFFVLIG